MSSKINKFISMLIVFVITFTYSGGTLEAIASTDGLSVITNGFSRSKEMEFKTYFGDRENALTENVSNVNEKATLMLEISPSKIREGFLKNGIITAFGVDGTNVNFRFAKIKNVTIEQVEDEVVYEENVPEEEIIETQEEENENVEDITEDTSYENVVEEAENEVIEENIVEKTTEEENTVKEEVTEEENTVEEETIIEENTITEETTTEEENIVEENTTNTSNTTQTESFITGGNIVTSRAGEGREESEELSDEEFVDEEKVIEEKTEELLSETYEELTAKDFEIEITDENEILVKNIIYNTIIEVEIEYNQENKINISDLYKEINLQLVGTYINKNLETSQIETNQTVNVGWSYSKEFETSGEYTQFSPFQLGTHEGIIVESKITVKRETEDENYLPVKQTTIEVDVPDYNDEQPETVSVQSSKLMATRGEDVGNLTFGTDNWSYNANSKKITITVNNEKDGTAVNSLGEDEYIIVYKYNSYTEDETVTMDYNYRATVEEYSGTENVTTTKEFTSTQEIKTQINNLITYNISTTSDKLNKAKINANYNSEEALYETDFVSTVNVNILTSDLLEELKINSSKDIYLDNNNLEFDATQDIYYSKVKFNYSEISSMLQNGATIEIQTTSGELLYTLNSGLVNSQDDCEVNLQSKEKGVFVVFKNVSVNGNVGIEFTKTIAKSNYNKSAFANFKKIKSYVSAELKYQSYEERYAMQEIATEKELEDSQTVAEVIMLNNNLSTTSKNDSVELRIVLNNDKQDSDLYVNPSFELVFPKYVKDVTLENIGLIYGSGLKIESNSIYKEDDLVKMRIDLSGTQTTFSESEITDGSNIILNLNIELDEYTPKKQDQIKMYYCNEGVTKYESQTKWTIGKAIPNGIIKETNGFDVAIINYQATSGMLLANSIINYDGQASKIKSIGQGEKTVEISKSAAAQNATMELVAINNTDNTCTDVVLIGRVPTEDATDVITGKEIGTNISTTMLDPITASSSNENTEVIYYSTNENATKDLNNSKNSWTTEVSDFSEIKSFMIVVNGELPAGTVLKYTYNFEIPEELGYDAEIYGNFGAYYNNNMENTVKYESAKADKVGLITESSPELKVTVSPYGGNKNIYYGQILQLEAKVENNTKEDIENATLKVTIPDGTVYTEHEFYEQEDSNGVFQRYTDDENIKEKEFEVSNLAVGDVTTFTFDVRVLDSKEESTTLKGTTEINGISKNYKLKAKPSEIEVTAELMKDEEESIYEGESLLYILTINNTTDEQIENVKLSYKLPSFESTKEILINNDEETFEYKQLIFTTNENNTIVDLGTLEPGITTVQLQGEIGELLTETSTIKNVFNVYESKNENKKYSSNVVEYSTAKAFITVDQSINSDEFTYGDTFEYRLNITNNSNVEEEVYFKNNLPKELEITQNRMFINGEEVEIDDDNLMSDIITVGANRTIQIVSIGQIVDANNTNEELELTNTASIDPISGSSIETNTIKVKINPAEKTEEIEEAEENIYEDDWVEDLDIETEDKGDEYYYDPQLDNEIYMEDEEKPEEEQEEEIPTYTLSGNVYNDENADGLKTEEDEKIDSQVQVQLIKGKTMVKATTTDSEGNYIFDKLESGDYTVVFNYDEDNYTSTVYNEEQTAETSKNVDIEEGVAVTDTITITDSSIENVNAGLQEKDKFDMEIRQYLTSSKLIIKNDETVYDYEKATLAKIEISPSESYCKIKL